MTMYRAVGQPSPKGSKRTVKRGKAVSGASRRSPWHAMVVGASALGELSGRETIRRLWIQSPAFQQAEVDDWNLVAEDLRASVRQVMKTNPDLAREVVAEVLKDVYLKPEVEQELAEALILATLESTRPSRRASNATDYHGLESVS